MYGAHNLMRKIEKHFMFSSEELKSLVLVILILGLVVGFDDGTPNFDFVFWLRNLVSSLVLVTLAVIVRESVRRIYALQLGHKVEFKIWWFGIGISLLIALVSYGKIPLLFYGGMMVNILPKHRLGYFRYGVSFNDMGGIAFATTVSSLLLALFFKFFLFIPNPFIEKAILINVIFACLNMLPIPPLDGSTIFFANRLGYVFALVFTVGTGILILKSSILMALFGGLGLAIVAALVYMYQVDSIEP